MWEICRHHPKFEMGQIEVEVARRPRTAFYGVQSEQPGIRFVRLEGGHEGGRGRRLFGFGLCKDSEFLEPFNQQLLSMSSTGVIDRFCLGCSPFLYCVDNVMIFLSRLSKVAKELVQGPRFWRQSRREWQPWRDHAQLRARGLSLPSPGRGRCRRSPSCRTRILYQVKEMSHKHDCIVKTRLPNQYWYSTRFAPSATQTSW